MLKYVVTIGIALVLAVSGAFGLADRSPSPAPETTSPPVVVVGAGQDLSAVITALQATLRRTPENAPSWASLALAYVEQARTTLDASLYDRADEAIERSLDITPDDNVPALVAGSALASARHDFTAALDLSEQALALDGFEPTALSLRVDALTELGRYEDQARAAEEADRLQPSVPTAARFAYVLELRGEIVEAADILERFAVSGSEADRAYLLTLAADLRRKDGDLEAAGALLDEVDRLAPDYTPASVSRARLQVAQSDLEAAEATWRGVVARLPLPEYLTELGELLLVLDREDEAQTQFDVVEASLLLLADGGVNVDLEDALYLADHGDATAARAAAEAEWDVRRSVHTADALAWARFQAGDPRAALAPARKATSLGSHEARFWLHRGTIEAALGLDKAAARHLRRGLTVDPGVSPWQAERARAVLRGLGVRP